MGSLQAKSNGHYSLNLALELALDYDLKALLRSAEDSILALTPNRSFNELKDLDFNLDNAQSLYNLLHDYLDIHSDMYCKLESLHADLSISNLKLLMKQQFLQELRKQIPSLCKGKKRFKYWWEANRITWVNLLEVIRWNDHDVELNLDRVLSKSRVVNPKLEQLLQQLKDELPTPIANLKDPLLGDWEQYKEWWKANGTDWTNKLRNLIKKHRNIGHSWDLSKEERELLYQYYYANKLLVDCLNNASNKVRSHIEDTLLLPIADIKKCKFKD